MTNLIYIGLIGGLSAVLIGCAVAYGVVQQKISAQKAVDRREYLKARARAL